jgi:hypothetical protein
VALAVPAVPRMDPAALLVLWAATMDHNILAAARPKVLPRSVNVFTHPTCSCWRPVHLANITFVLQ